MSTSSNWGQFKSTSSEIGTWLWGMAQGGFNEKQTIGQVCTDAVISMFPIAGEATAVRDVTASVIRMCEYPEKREETAEWVQLILPLLAIIPLLGGALKGVGKLLMMVGKSPAQDKEILKACLFLLNKVGRGNQVKFLKELDLMRYNSTLVKGANEAFRRIDMTLKAAQKLTALPKKALERFAYLRQQLAELNRLTSKMVPQALKDLNNKLKYIQKLAYEGEWHSIPGAGKHITREVEGRLVSKNGKMEWELKDAPWPQNKITDFEPEKGYPNFKAGKYARELKGGAKDATEGLQIVQSFHGPMKPVELTEGEVLYRVIDHANGNASGAYWMRVDPKTIKGAYWRVKFAVLQRFSHNGEYVKFVVPKGKTLRVWEGKVSSQIDNDVTRGARDAAGKINHGQHVGNEGFGQYLEGGEMQLFIDFEFAANEWAKPLVDALQKLPTHWPDHMNINLVPKTADVQRLGMYVEEQKTLAAANLSVAANQTGKAVRYGNQK